ncbi:MAG: SRPBCC family protein [Actinomycetota bacterium]
MGTVRRHIFIDANADTVWSLVGDPGLLHEWFPTTSTKLEGSKRWITLASGITFEEDVITLDHDLRRFQYRIVNNPIITQHLGTVDVIPDGDDRCIVIYSTDMEPEVLALPIAGAAGVGLEALKRRFEKAT